LEVNPTVNNVITDTNNVEIDVSLFGDDLPDDSDEVDDPEDNNV